LSSLTNEKAFIRWKLTPEGKKIPVGLDGNLGIEAQAGTFEDASKIVGLDGVGGVGLVFTGALPVAFIDIDDYDNNFLVQLNLLRLFKGKAYIESSVSKNGYHVIAHIEDKDQYSHLKTSKFELYFQDRFCALTGDKHPDGVDLEDVLAYDCTELFRKVYRALRMLVGNEEPCDELISVLRKGSISHFDSPSEFDYALVKTAMKYTSDKDTIHGILLLSESDVERERKGKEPKTVREDYVLNTIKAVSKQWNKYLVTDHFDFQEWDNNNLVYISNKPIVRREAFTVIRSLTGIGKGHFTLSILASLFEGSKHTLGAYSKKGDWSVLYVDTEMGRDLTSKMRDMFIRKIGHDPGPKAIFASVKEARVEERIAIISRLSGDFKPSVVVIDGLRDLIFNFNDTVQTYTIIQELERLSISMDCAVVGTIHVNPSQDNPKSRGHLGTEIEQKAFTVLHIERVDEDNTIIVKHVKGRTGHFAEFNVRFDSSEGYLVQATATNKQGQDLPF
jgi:hypothetical protein